MPEVFFADEQTDLAVDGERMCELARLVLSAEGVTDRAEVSLIAVDAAAMTELHKRFLGKPGPTDVLAFPIEEGPWERAAEESGNDAPVLLGDVLVCPVVAAENGPDHAGTYEAELDLLIVHGLLHLLGWDHATDTEADRMEARDRELLARFARAQVR